VAANVQSRDPGQPLVGSAPGLRESNRDVRVPLAPHRSARYAAGEFGVDQDVRQRVVNPRIAGGRQDRFEFGAGERFVGLFHRLAGDIRSALDPLRRETEVIVAADHELPNPRSRDLEQVAQIAREHVVPGWAQHVRAQEVAPRERALDVGQRGAAASGDCPQRHVMQLRLHSTQVPDHVNWGLELLADEPLGPESVRSERWLHAGDRAMAPRRTVICVSPPAENMRNYSPNT
jgi:hypothetical protein